MQKICVHCEIEFDTNSPQKRTAGGKINECPDCVEELGTETAIKHRGVTSFEDNEVQVLSFDNEDQLQRFNTAKNKESSRLE